MCVCVCVCVYTNMYIYIYPQIAVGECRIPHSVSGRATIV